MAMQTENNKGINLNRRAFLRGTFAAGALAAAGSMLAACSPAQSTGTGNGTASGAASGGAGATGSSVSDWLGTSPTVEESQIAETNEFDVVVLGAGVAGLCAANAAVEEGVKVALLDKNVISRYGGSFHSACNAKMQLDADVIQDPAELVKSETVKFATMNDPSLLSLWAYESGRIFDWMLEKTERNGVVSFMPFTKYADDFNPEEEANVTIPGSIFIGWDYFLETGKESERFLLDALKTEALASGAKLFFSTPAQYLETGSDGSVTGVVAKNESGEYVRFKAAKGVVVCTGDFSGNPDMCNAFLPPLLARDVYEKNMYTSYMAPDEQLSDGRLNSGDGHKMICWAGGVMEDNPCATMGWPMNPELALMPFMAVNSAGQRFANESSAFMIIGRLAYNQPAAATKGTHFWKILDADFQDEVAQMRPICMFGEMNAVGDPESLAASPNFTANSIEELAALIDVEPTVLKASVNRYNELCGAKEDKDFGKPSRYLHPIDTPPFYAVYEQQQFAVTVGGVICNRSLEVCSTDGSTISGLYAAGNVVGRRFGPHYEASLPGLSNAYAIVHGYTAGQNAAKR
jgi:fumarate reductase flavoprotein subunit